MSKSVAILMSAFLYLAVCCGLSLYASKKGKRASTLDYFVASNQLGFLVLSLTAMATAFSAFAFLGQLGQVYNYGTSAIYNFMNYGIISYPLFFLIGSKLWFFGKKYGYITPADFIADRYDTNIPARLLIGLIICVYFSIFYIVIQIRGCSYVLEEATSMTTPIAALIIALILGIYVAIGGMRAVAFTDVMQAIFLLAGVLTVTFTMIAHAGGFGSLFRKAIELRPDTYLPKQNMMNLITGGLVMGLSMPIWPQLWTKYYCAKDLRTCYGVAAGCGLGTVLVTVSLPLIIVAGLVIAYPKTSPADADKLVIRYMLDFANPVVAAIVIGGLLSAAMSTADALLLLVSSVFTIDMAQALPSSIRKYVSEGVLVRFGQLMVFVIIIVAYLISLRPLGQLVTVGIRLTFPGYLVALPVVVGGLWWRRANKQGAISALVVGLITIYIITFVKANPLHIAGGLWGLATATITFIVVSLLTKPTPQEILAKFGLGEG